MFQSKGLQYFTLRMLALLVVSIALWGVGCSEDNEHHDEGAHPHTSSHSPATRPLSESLSQGFDDYPLTICVVSGEPLDAMGEAFVIRHEGREVRFCCKSCVAKFKDDPPKYLAMLARAAKSGHNAKSQGMDQHDGGHHHDPTGHVH